MKKTSPNNIIMDTHVWLWHLTGHASKVNKQAIKIIDKASRDDRLWVSVISVWELAILEQKKRIQFNMDLYDWVEYSKNVANIKICPLNESIALDSVDLKNFLNHDPADRFIIATTKMINGKLITRDHDIIKYAQGNNIDIVNY